MQQCWGRWGWKANQSCLSHCYTVEVNWKMMGCTWLVDSNLYGHFITQEFLSRYVWATAPALWSILVLIWPPSQNKLSNCSLLVYKLLYALSKGRSLIKRAKSHIELPPIWIFAPNLCSELVVLWSFFVYIVCLHLEENKITRTSVRHSTYLTPPKFKLGHFNVWLVPLY